MPENKERDHIDEMPEGEQRRERAPFGVQAEQDASPIVAHGSEAPQAGYAAAPQPIPPGVGTRPAAGQRTAREGATYGAGDGDEQAGAEATDETLRDLSGDAPVDAPRGDAEGIDGPHMYDERPIEDKILDPPDSAEAIAEGRLSDAAMGRGPDDR